MTTLIAFLSLSLGALTQPELADVGLRTTVGQSVDVPPSVVAEDGQPAALPDPPLLLVPADYGCHNLCDVVLDGLVETLEQAAVRLPVVVVSFDQRDGMDAARAMRAALANRYPRASLADWQFWSEPGASSFLPRLGVNTAWDPQIEQFAHEAGLIVVGADSRVSSVLRGVRFAPGAVRLAVHGGSASAAGQALRLLCFDYDPATGSRSLSVLKVLRTLSALFVAGLGWWLWRSRRRTQP